MSGVGSAVRWWDEWQLRILVLASLILQWFMLVAAPMRKYTIPPLFRASIWLAYVSSDALAIYALATLFNRHARAVSCSGSDGEAGVLEVLWAPVLLIHLGGQREVNAYSIEDNELWMRHTLTLVSQVALALYAFFKSWSIASTDMRLSAAAFVLFVVGMLSFCEKPWAFYRARIHRLAVVSSLMQGTSRRRENSRWCFCFNELDKDEFMHNVGRCSFCCGTGGTAEKTTTVWSRRNKVHMLLSDLSLYAAAIDQVSRDLADKQEQDPLPPAVVSAKVKDVLGPAIGAERFAKKWLVRAFGLIYTRYNVVWTPAYLAHHLLLVPALHLAAITLFAVSHKPRVYNPVDVKTTYILLFFTAALDIIGVFFPDLLHRLMSARGATRLCEWIVQYNLIDRALRRWRPNIMGRLITMCNLERYFLRESDNPFSQVSGYLFVDLLARNEYSTAGLDLTSYRNLELSDPNWTLSTKLREDACRDGTEVRKTLLASFDKSVLLWHLATDLCFCHEPSSAARSDRETRTEAISNYMSYLLNFHPDMLMTGSRRHLFTDAMDDIQSILREETLPVGRRFKHPNDKALAEAIFRHASSSGENSGPAKYPLLHDACRLAQELLRLPRDTRFELLYRVWVGMLCYSATMCRGYLHAKSLGEGGEFLSFVWLLLCIKGCRTLADKLQMPPVQNTDFQMSIKDENYIIADADIV